jgi:hypothetical protein
MASKKINKKFVLSDSSVNEYGFRLLSSGYLMDEFLRNPIGYYMHRREDGVALKWCDMAVEEDNVVGYPEINLSNPRGEQMADEVENGFLNAASVGHIVVLEYSTDPAMMLPGQTGPTVTKWYNKECSLVDIPGNSNALCQLFDAEDNVINLADFNNQIKIPMEKKDLVLTPEVLKALNLVDGSDNKAVAEALNTLAAKALKADALETENATLKTDKTKLEGEIAGLKKAATDKDVTDQLDVALKGGKITAKLKETLAKQYEGKPAELKALLAEMPGNKLVTDQLKAGSEEGPDGIKYDKATWDKMFKDGTLEDLKAKNPDAYNELYKAKYNKYPKGVSK